MQKHISQSARGSTQRSMASFPCLSTLDVCLQGAFTPLIQNFPSPSRSVTSSSFYNGFSPVPTRISDSCRDLITTAWADPVEGSSNFRNPSAVSRAFWACERTGSGSHERRRDSLSRPKLSTWSFVASRGPSQLGGDGSVSSFLEVDPQSLPLNLLPAYFH
jgi:hypothetical protein